MIIIGERINSTREKIGSALKSHDLAAILKAAHEQIDAGAAFIDLNCAMSMESEIQDMDWAVSAIQSDIKDVSLCIDSPHYLAIERACKVYTGTGELMINSITGEQARIDHILPLILKYRAKVIALTMTEAGMPTTADERFAIARTIFEKVTKAGVRPEDIYFDPLIRPIATEPDQAREFLKAIPLIKSLGGVKTVCGLSNISYGLPARSVVNAAFLTMAIAAGLDAAIIDPLDKRLGAAVYASEALLGTDEYCGRYIGAFREGRLG